MQKDICKGMIKMEYNYSDKISGVTPSVIREILKFANEPGIISLAAGNPAFETIPVEFIESAAADILKNQAAVALSYNISEGYNPLRAELRTLMEKRYNIDMEKNELIVVAGAQQGLDYTPKVLCNEGDTVLCENPTFVGALNAFRAYNVNLVGIDIDKNGMTAESLQSALNENKNVKFLYLIPNFQNPAGSTMSLQNRKDVLALCQKENIIILEDNPYGDIRFYGEDIPSIKSMDTNGNVIYLGSFSKILSAGLRVGYIVAPKEMIGKFTIAKQVNDVHTTILSQMICHKFLTEYDFAAHIDNNKAFYKEKCELMVGLIREHFSPNVKFNAPEGGLFIWCTLPDNIDMQAFCKEAVNRGVAVVPGNAFSADESAPCQSVRLNFSTPTKEQIEKAVPIIGALTKELDI